MCVHCIMLLLQARKGMAILLQYFVSAYGCSVGAAPTKDVSAQVEDHIEPEKFIGLCTAARPHLSTGYIAASCCTNNSQRSQNKE